MGGGTTPFPILENGSAARRRAPFRATQELEALLRRRVRGEVRFDATTRALYAMDSSNYRQTPIGVVAPRDAEDVEATIAACRELGAPVLSRGGGTSVAGQTCNAAVVLDFSKYMRSVVELDPAARTARVQPGLVLDALREQAERHELTFAPDPATHSRCTLGGMIGNNSCGVHALYGGKTVDNIHALEVLLYDGTRMRVGATSEEELGAIVAQGGRRGAIYAGMRRLRDRYGALVRERFPDIPRRVSGYNLDQLLPENGFHVARALVGSEGTCVTVLEATCELKPSPQHRRLVALGFRDAFVAADQVPAVLEHRPIGLEGFDGYLVECMLRKNLQVDDVRLLPPGGGFLLCEMGADSAAEAEAMVEALRAGVERFPERPSWAAYTHEEAERVWKVRESGLGASVFVPGEASGWEGWEDAAVPPALLGRYLRDLAELLGRYGYKTPMYGHFGQGCVHNRMTFDLRSAEGIEKYRRFVDEAADIVLRYGGSFSGEHGDGQARAALLPKMFGPELMQGFREFKALWDPENRMNPGKLIDPEGVYEITENLRFGAGYRPTATRTWFAYEQDGGLFSEATTRCVGVGQCRKQDAGTMCPSYMATQEERHSTRGRAHLLWEMLEGGTIQEGWRSEGVRDALELCLSCKACKTECPTNVDMATWKAEFLAHYYEGRVHPLHHYAFGWMDRWARIGGLAPRVANATLGLPGAEALAKRLVGVARERRLPRLAERSFRAGFRGDAAGTGERVLLWADTWNNYFDPGALQAAAKLLREAGCSVGAAERHVCCGRPLYDFGFLDEARAYLRRILEEFAEEIDAGVPVVMLEPSCATVFRDELLSFFPREERARRLSRQTVMLSEMLTRRGWQPPAMEGRRIVVHGHCHQKALLTMKDEMRLLEATGARVEMLDSGCCGMAGPFGFEREKYEVSQALAERVLLPAVRAADAEDVVVTNGFSCREQIHQNTARRAVHLAQVLAGECGGCAGG